METFTWRVTTDSSGGGEFKVASSEFGDGYTQDAALGLNNDKQDWSVLFFGQRAAIDAVLAFVRAHRGATPFLWTPPLGVQGTYQCTGYRINPLGGVQYSLSLTFKQVFRP